MEIIEEVFKGLGFSAFSSAGVTKRPAKRTYCVQYRESDFEFVSRLLEEEGIFYYFEHRNGEHVMVMGDSSSAYTPSTEQHVGRLSTLSALQNTDDVYRWEHRYQFRGGVFVQRDFDFTRPRERLVTKAPSLISLDNTSTLERFDYPGNYRDNGTGKRLTERRMEASESEHEAVMGESVCRGLGAGLTFTLDDHPHPDEAGRSYVVRRVRHEAELAGGYLTGQESSDQDYRNSFEAVPSNVPLTPERVTPKPLVSGVQTAIVSGPAGDEIYTDEHGRVKVQFHWDRRGKSDENSSCWIRVSQAWAGAGWGGLQVPRVGQEVVADFLEGDPDRPLVIGRVYNAESMPPVSGSGRDEAEGEVNPRNVMEAAMQTTLRSNSLGGSGGHNEITMHDGGGEEKLFFRAEKDEVHLVQNSRKDTVGNNEARSVGNDRTRSVANNESVDVGNDRAVSVGNNETMTIGADNTIDVGSHFKLKAGSSITLQCGASSITMYSGGVITISGTVVTMAGAANANVAAPITNISGAALLTQTGAGNLRAGMVTRTDVGSTAVISSGGKEAIEAGGETIVKGAAVKING